MKLPRKEVRKARIEIIPMIDTMFFLLVFFMLATLTMTNQQVLPVNLPRANGVQDKSQQVVMLTLTKDGNFFYDKEPITTVADAVGRLQRQSKEGKELSVIINADRTIEHGRVVELMDGIRKIGITHIAIAVTPSG